MTNFIIDPVSTFCFFAFSQLTVSQLVFRVVYLYTFRIRDPQKMRDIGNTKNFGLQALLPSPG